MLRERNSLDLGDENFPHEQIAATISPKLQQLVILPTEKCNFRCTYCYEDFAIGKMKEPVQQAVLNFLSRRIPELHELNISWFGGEPLVARDVVLRISSHASRLCRENECRLHGGLTTNAYLLDRALFEELLSFDQRFFQITLDGWGEGHDVVRKLANGKGSFERIWDNLKTTKASEGDFAIQLRIHVRRDNLESLEILVDHLAATFGCDPRYSLDFEHLRDLGGEGGKTVRSPLTLAEMRVVEKRLRERFQSALPAESTARMQETAPDATVSMPKYICYASKPNSLLIRSDGRIGKCTVALTDERNTIGRMNADGSIEVDNSRLRLWVRGLNDLNVKSLECPLHNLPELSAA